MRRRSSVQQRCTLRKIAKQQCFKTALQTVTIQCNDKGSKGVHFNPPKPLDPTRSIRCYPEVPATLLYYRCLPVSSIDDQYTQSGVHRSPELSASADTSDVRYGQVDIIMSFWRIHCSVTDAQCTVYSVPTTLKDDCRTYRPTYSSPRVF